MAKIGKEILKELARFNQLNENVDNVNEGAGLANLGMGSHLDRLAKKFNIDMTEQEDIEEPEAEEEPTDMGGDAELAGEEEPTDAGEEAPMDAGAEEDLVGMEEEVPTDEPTAGTTELDVTDLVKKDEEISDEISSQKDILSKNTESLDDLMSKLSDLETHLSSMDDMVNKISDLEVKIEKYRPRTPQEKLELRKHDSGPFNSTLTDFFVDKEEVFDKTGKKQYILTPEEVENYNESEIKQSLQDEED